MGIDKIKKAKGKLETVQIGDYTDQSNEILREMRVHVDEEDEESWKDCFYISLYRDKLLVIFWKKYFSKTSCHNYLTRNFARIFFVGIN